MGRTFLHGCASFCISGMERGRLAPVVLLLYTESYYGGEAPPLHSTQIKLIA